MRSLRRNTTSFLFLENLLVFASSRARTVTDGYRLGKFRVSNGIAGCVREGENREDGGVSDGCPMGKNWDDPNSRRAIYLDTDRKEWWRVNNVQGCGAQR